MFCRRARTRRNFAWIGGGGGGGVLIGALAAGGKAFSHTGGLLAAAWDYGISPHNAIILKTNRKLLSVLR